MATKKIVEDIFPLGPMQQGLLFHTLFNSASGEYFQQLHFKIHGELGIPAYKRAWQQVVNRYATLRTSFIWEEADSPLQLVLQHAELPWKELDWRNLSLSEQGARFDAYLIEDRKRGFDLAKAPLMRLTLIRLGEDTYECVWSHHHLLLDGWSLAIVLREILIYYETLNKGETIRLENARPYRDYVAWLLHQDMSKAEAFWREELKGFVSPTPMGVDIPIEMAPNQKDYDAQYLRLSRATTDSLKAMGRLHQLTLNTILQGAWTLILSRYSGEEEVMFGSVVSGRPAEFMGIEKMVGLFINTLPVRVRVSPKAVLLPLLRELQAHQFELRQYEYSPLVEIQGWSEVSRGTPLFQSIMVFENYPIDESLKEQKGSFEISDVQMIARTSFPLSISIIPYEELLLKVVYRCNRFSDEQIAGLLDQMQFLLQQVAVNPEQVVENYSLIDLRARKKLPDPAAPLHQPQYELVTDSISKWADFSPHQSAVYQGRRTWSYMELIDRSRDIAQCLQMRGLQSGDVVAVRSTRSFGLIASMLGVMFAGGVMMPIDPLLPVKRIQLMLSESKAKHYINTSPQKSGDFCNDDTIFPAVLRVNEENGFIIENKCCGTKAGVLQSISYDDAAYIFFTSGTTGIPKGVLGSHKGLAHFLSWQRNTYSVDKNDRCAQLTALSFDVVLRDILLPFTSGAALMLPEGDIYDSEYIIPWMEREKITVIHTVPAIVKSWLSRVHPNSSLQHLRLVFFAGEPLEGSLLNQWRETFPLAGELVNLYGPTETTLAKCHYRIPPNPLPGIQPVGSPLPETQALVLSSNNRLCGVGELGEIVIRSPFRSLGYVNPSEEDKLRFFNNPFTEEKKDLLYRTGDYGRFRADGTLEVKGRIDHQMKIRGMRVEVSEIESVLTQCANIQAAVVIMCQFKLKAAEKRLVAYLVKRSDEISIDIGALRQFLRERLPEYMVPSNFIILEALPLTINGKVDRGALLDLEEVVTRQPENAFVPPRTSVEESLVKIWEEVLEVEGIGIYDNFFDLGGHSLLLTMVASRLRDVLQINLSLRDIFEAKNILELAEKINTLQWSAQKDEAVLSYTGDEDEGEI